MRRELARALLDLLDDYGTMDAAARKGILQEVMELGHYAVAVIARSDVPERHCPGCGLEGSRCLCKAG